MPVLGSTFLNFNAKTTEGVIELYNWMEESWCILFSHPSDFTPVCTTELARLINLLPEFKLRNTKVIGLSCDSVESHHAWCKDIQKYAGCKEGETFPYPIIADADREVAVKLGMLDKDELDSAGMPLSARAVFIIDPNKKFRLQILYPATTGRNFDEILRVLDSLQLADTNKVATPADFKHFDEELVPVLAQDQQLQKRERPQEPLSDAYLTGMPARKCARILARRPHVTVESMYHEISEAIDQILPPLEADQFGNFLLDSVRSAVQERASASEDYTPARFPATSRFLAQTPQSQPPEEDPRPSDEEME